MTDGARVAVLGGTFDPIHLGHLTILAQVIDAISADGGLLVPSHTPPHRPPAMATPEQRLAMARAALSWAPGLEVDELEIERGGSSFTIDSLDQWAVRRPGAEINLILGADAARGIPGWHRSAELLAIGHFVIVNRDGVERVSAPEAAGLGFAQDRTRLVSVVSPPVSASEIRRRLAAGQEVASMLAPGVLRLIEREGLYRRSDRPVR